MKLDTQRKAGLEETHPVCRRECRQLEVYSIQNAVFSDHNFVHSLSRVQRWHVARLAPAQSGGKSREEVSGWGPAALRDTAERRRPPAPSTYCPPTTLSSKLFSRWRLPKRSTDLRRRGSCSLRGSAIDGQQPHPSSHSGQLFVS